MLNRGSPVTTSSATADRSLIPNRHSSTIRWILDSRNSPASSSSSEQRGTNPRYWTLKTIASNIGRKPGSNGQLMKTWLFLSRVVTGRAGIGLHAFEHHLADSPPDLGGDGAFLRMLLNANHSICLVVSDLTVSSVNHELSRPLLLDAFLGSADSPLLGRKDFGRLAFLLYRPSFAGTEHMKCFRRHIVIVCTYRAWPAGKISGGTF